MAANHRVKVIPPVCNDHFGVEAFQQLACNGYISFLTFRKHQPLGPAQGRHRQVHFGGVSAPASSGGLYPFF